MNEPAPVSAELAKALASVGLEVVVGDFGPDPVIAAALATRAANGYEVVPAYSVPVEASDAFDQLDSVWNRERAALRLYAPDRAILLRVAVADSSRIPWIAVRDSYGEDLPSRSFPQSPEQSSPR